MKVATVLWTQSSKIVKVTYIYVFVLLKMMLLKMLLPLTWNNIVLFLKKSLYSYLTNHRSYQDIFIDNPGVQLTKDWIFGSKEGSLGATASSFLYKN